MTPDGHFIVDRLPGTSGLYVASGCNVGGLSISPPIGEDLSRWIVAGASGRARSSRCGSTASATATTTRSCCARTASRRTRTSTTRTRWRTGDRPASSRRESSRDERHHRSGGSVAAIRAGPDLLQDGHRPGPAGLAASSRSSSTSRRATRSGQGLVFFLSVVVLFPRANIYVALIIAGVGELLRVDDVRRCSPGRSRESAATTRSTRACCRPGSRSAATSASFMGGLFGVPIFGYFMATLALSPALAVIGGVTGLEHAGRRWSTYFSTVAQDRRVHHDARHRSRS